MAFAILMMLLVQAGFMLLDLALRKALSPYLGSVVLYLVTTGLLGLGAYVGMTRACVRYAFADRSAIVAVLVVVAVAAGLIGFAAGESGAFASAALIHGGYTLAQIAGGSVAVHRHPRRNWSSRW